MTPLSADAPLALIGYGPSTARALRELGLVALAVPTAPLAEVLGACVTLGFAGALVADALGADAFALTQPDGAARLQGRVDALSFAAATHGTHTLQDALLRSIEASGYAARGGRALIVGDGEGLLAALGVARLGLRDVTVASGSLPEAERALAALPAGVRGHAVTRHDPALITLAERVDLVVLASGDLPRGLLQPYHALLDLAGAGEGAARHAQASLIPLGDLNAQRLALALEHATGQRFKAEALGPVAGLVTG